MKPTHDNVLTALTSYRPTDATIEAEWSQLSREAALEEILSRPPDTDAPIMRRLRVRRRYVVAAIGVTAAGTLAAVGGIVLPANSPGGPETAIAAPFQRLQATALHDPQPVVGPGQFAYVSTAAHSTRHGKIVEQGSTFSKDWTALNGDAWNWHRESGRTSCSSGRFRGTPNIGGNVNQNFLNDLPTDPDTLSAYMRSHLLGSSSRDHAVFVAVEDSLIKAGGLASPELRAALIGVLAQTDHVTVHENVHDVLKRKATRVDFEDQARQPGVRNSLYFDPSTSQLIQSEESSTDGSGRGNVQVMNTQKVVDSLPASMTSCADAGE